MAEPGRLAQSGTSLTTNQGVTGSSPGPATFFRVVALITRRNDFVFFSGVYRSINYTGVVLILSLFSLLHCE